MASAPTSAMRSTVCSKILMSIFLGKIFIVSNALVPRLCSASIVSLRVSKLVILFCHDDDTKGISLELGQLNSGNNDIKIALHAKKDTHTEGEDNDPTKYEMGVNTYSLGIEAPPRVW